jgi:hypothetical protein
LPSFLSSVVHSQSLVVELLLACLHLISGTCDPLFTAAVNDWQSRIHSPHVQMLFSSAQKVWDKALVDIQEKKVLSAAPDQASFEAFLHARPCSSLSTRLDISSLRISVALRLGAPVCALHVCICGSAVDSTGRHGRSCRKSACRLSRRGAVNDIIKRALSSAEVPCRLEPPSLMRDDGKRPDRMSMSPWSNGHCFVWDFTCPNTLAHSHLNSAVCEAGVVAREAEIRKWLKYSACQRFTASCRLPSRHMVQWARMLQTSFIYLVSILLRCLGNDELLSFCFTPQCGNSAIRLILFTVFAYALLAATVLRLLIRSWLRPAVLMTRFWVPKLVWCAPFWWFVTSYSHVLFNHNIRTECHYC